MSILDSLDCGLPSFFQYLLEKTLIHSDHVLVTKDRFYMICKIGRASCRERVCLSV